MLLLPPETGSGMDVSLFSFRAEFPGIAASRIERGRCAEGRGELANNSVGCETVVGDDEHQLDYAAG